MASVASDMSTVGTLDELYAALTPLGAKALWNRPATPGDEPKKRFRPAAWRYRDMHQALDVAGRLMDSDAERRAICLVNPAATGVPATAATLICCYQMILPGERAVSHRHTPNALRFILQAEPGTYTVVNGVRYDMEPNDVVLTPNWYWHGHANEGKLPTYWVDYLDVPFVAAIEPMFFETAKGGFQTPTETAKPSAPFLYRWTETAAKLKAAPAEASGRFGRQIAFDKHDFGTIGLFMCALDGQATKPLHTTANNIYTVVEGHGRSIVDGQILTWERGDVIVAPAWNPHHHEPDGNAVLFRVTDEPLLKTLNLLKTK